MDNSFVSLLFLLIASCSSTTTDDYSGLINSNFIDVFESQSTFDTFWEHDPYSTTDTYYIGEGNLNFTTSANNTDRVKVKTLRNDFGVGTYKWRVYAAERTIGDKNSIGAFLYSDDQHEIDFEIGSGKVDVRNQLNAQDDDLLLYCTSQDNPYVSNPYLIKHNSWYTLKIEISYASNQNYQVKWYVDNTLLQTQILDYGSDVLFAAHCSLETLNFIGDQIPTQSYSTKFNYFSFIE